MPSGSETEAAVSVAQLCSEEILFATTAGLTAWAKSSLQAAQFLMRYVKWWDSLVSSTDRLWPRTFPLLPGWSQPLGKSMELLGDAVSKQEWSCSSASQRSALLCFLWLTAGGGSSLPVYTLPCALLLNPRLPDSRKSSKSQQLLPLHSLPPRRNGEKGALSASPGLFPRRTLQNCSYFPELLEKALPRGSQPRLAFPHARLAVLKECGFLLPSQTSGLSWLGCSAACLHRLPGSCLLFLSRRAGERVREGQMVLHCFFCLKACSFFFSKISSIGS